jgi:hypothetical protein
VRVCSAAMAAQRLELGHHPPGEQRRVGHAIEREPRRPLHLLRVVKAAAPPALVISRAPRS